MCKLWGNFDFALDTIYTDNDEFLKEHWDTICEFAKTPVKERYSIKKYYVKLDLPYILDEEECYLNRHMTFDGNIEQRIGSKNGFTFRDEIYQTQFTIEEIEEIIPKEDMDKFKIIPVEEDK